MHFTSLKRQFWSERFEHAVLLYVVMREILQKSIQELETLCVNLPTSSGDLDAEKVGLLLEDEMKRMDEAIKKAVQVIEDLQKKSRATDSGIRYEFFCILLLFEGGQ